jgi:hypothetical protein
MERDVGDILDRWSIAKLKKNRIGNEENIKEFAAFSSALEELRTKYQQYDWEQFCDIIWTINNYIWQLEAGLKGGKDDLPDPHYILDPKNEKVLTKIGLLSICIRNFNSLRVKFKNIVNKLTNTGFQDEKRYHLSAENNELLHLPKHNIRESKREG